MRVHPISALKLAMLAMVACTSDVATKDTAPKLADSAFTAVQQRGERVMGVDQDAAKHVFEDLPDGGRVVLDWPTVTDTAEIRKIRGHMREIAADFTAGNFSKPFAVHAQTVPGTRTMTAKRAVIRYEAVDRAQGAEVRMRTTDSSAIQAIHDFLAFQRSDHRSAGHDGHKM